MSVTNYVELGQQLEAKRAQYRKQWDGYPSKTLADGQSVKDIPANDLEGLRKLMDDINDLSVKHETARAAEEKASEIERLSFEGSLPANRSEFGIEGKGIADLLLGSDQWKSRVGGKVADFELAGKAIELIEGKATMTTSAGYAPSIVRDGKAVPAISRPVQLLDLLRLETTDQNSVKFMKQTTRTNAADVKAEGAAFDEATIIYTEATVPIRRIGVHLPVTEEQLEDEPGVRALIEHDLRLMVRQKLDEQVTVGDGTGQNLLGLYNAVGAGTQARGTDEEFDQIMKAMGQVRVNGRAKPNLVLLHSTNYQRLALTKTADGIYIFGNPADAPLQRVWGIQIAMSEALAAGTGLVVDTEYARLKVRKDASIASSDSHADNFTKSAITLRAQVRAGLQILRDEAVCKMTGLRA